MHAWALSAIGILQQASREIYPRYVNLFLYFLAEIAIAACDLAEVLVWPSVYSYCLDFAFDMGEALTVLDTFLLLF